MPLSHPIAGRCQAADLMWLPGMAAWCRWGRAESIHGTIRAELRLLAPSDGGRQPAIPGPGILRPLWDISRDAGPDLRVARLWVEHQPELPPGETGTVRLLPLVAAEWRGIEPGQTITMHERTPAIGTATVIAVIPPA